MSRRLDPGPAKLGKTLVERVPVLKMPPDLAIPALRVLRSSKTAADRRAGLAALRPGLSSRTIVNAYALPSLSALALFVGSRASGFVTKYGREIASAPADEAQALFAKHLLGLDRENVGLVDWVERQTKDGPRSRSHLIQQFATDRLGSAHPLRTSYIDRLTKWSAYIQHFGIIREEPGRKGVRWSVSDRHLDALASGTGRHEQVDTSAAAEALLTAYANATRKLGTRLYIPIVDLRDQLGDILRMEGKRLTDFALNDILRSASALLPGHIVTFSPFSGPARGGLQIGRLYAGFISIRPTTPARKRPGAGQRG